MEISKVIRIVAIALIVAAFAIRIATRLLFPGVEGSHDGILTIILLLCLANIWRETAVKTEE